MITDLPLIPGRNVVAHFARWAVQLAPLGMPERLPECLAALRVHMHVVGDSQWGIDTVRGELTRFTASDPVVRLWSYPLVQQDDPAKRPSEEHLHIDPTDLVERTVASLEVEARHAQDVCAAQGLQEHLGYHVVVKVSEQTANLIGRIGRAVANTMSIDVDEPVPIEVLLERLTQRFPEHFSSRVHLGYPWYYGRTRTANELIYGGTSVVEGWPMLEHCLNDIFAANWWKPTCEFIGNATKRFRLKAGGTEYVVCAPVDSNVSFAELAATALLAMPSVTPDRVREAQDSVRALLPTTEQMSRSASERRDTKIEVDPEKLMPLPSLLYQLTQRYPEHFTRERRSESHGITTRYFGLMQGGNTTEILTVGGDDTWSWLTLGHALACLGQQRGWTGLSTCDAFDTKTIHLNAPGFECTVRAVGGRVPFPYLTALAMLQVPVEVSE